MNKKMELSKETKEAIDSMADLPTSALATALIFAMAETISYDNPPSDEEGMDSLLEEASIQATQLAESIHIIFENKEITRH